MKYTCNGVDRLQRRLRLVFAAANWLYFEISNSMISRRSYRDISQQANDGEEGEESCFDDEDHAQSFSERERRGSRSRCSFPYNEFGQHGREAGTKCLSWASTASGKCMEGLGRRCPAQEAGPILNCLARGSPYLESDFTIASYLVPGPGTISTALSSTNIRTKIRKTARGLLAV